MKVNNEIDIQEINDEALPISNDEKIIIESHWNDDKFIVLIIKDVKYTISAEELNMAIDNATNSKSY